MTAAARLAMRTIAQRLAVYQYRFKDEEQLKDSMQAVLRQSGFSFVREYTPVSADEPDRRPDRFDFWLPDQRIVVEVKIKGSFAEALRQIDRYCARTDVGGVILAASLYWATAGDLDSLRGNPVEMVYLRRQSF